MIAIVPILTTIFLNVHLGFVKNVALILHLNKENLSLG